jgi:hypothetical protein
LRFWCRWLIWLIYVVVWTWALLLPEPGEFARFLLLGRGEVIPGPSLEVRQHLLEFMQSFLFSKGLHVTAYALLAVLSACLRVRGRARWLLVAFMSLHAMATEFLQGFEPSRHPSWRDVGLDHLGFLLGMGLTWRSWLLPTDAVPDGTVAAPQGSNAQT